MRKKGWAQYDTVQFSYSDVILGGAAHCLFYVLVVTLYYILYLNVCNNIKKMYIYIYIYIYNYNYIYKLFSIRCSY